VKPPRILFALAGLLLLAACSSASRTVDRLDLDEGTLRAGMSDEDAVALLGEPAHRGVGSANCRYAKHFYDFRPVRDTVEMVWRRPGRLVVAYLRGSIITHVGRLDTR